ncbi:MAG: Fur family transcriptional regulator [Bacillota bacterium]
MRPEVEAFQRILAEKGYRVTPQRVGIYEYLLESKRHPSAEDIYQALKDRFPMMSQATVYKTLELLLELGLITELGFGAAASRYDGNPSVHINILCTACHRIYDVVEPELARLAESVAEQSGFVVSGQRHELYGICPECQRRRGAHVER